MSSKLTVAQLKAELTKKGIEFEPKMKKAALVLLLDGEEKEEDDDRDAEEAPKATKAKAKAKKAPKGKKRAEPEPAEEEEAPETDVKKILEKKAKETKKSTGVKKKDPTAPSHTGNVYQAYQATLNQTNVGANNNKFYIAEIHQNGNSYFLFTKWGRVGEGGQSKLDTFSSAQAAIAAFSKKFKDKTGNHWGATPFVSKSGKYDLLAMDDDADEEEVAEAEAQNSEFAPSELPKPTQEFLKLIFDTDTFKAEMKRMDLDTEKMPLGKLSAGQLLKGYSTLEELQGAIESAKKSDIERLTSRFYTEIPHSFGRSKPPLIADLASVQIKFDMLNTLSDIADANNMQAEGKKKAAAKQKSGKAKNLAPNPLDSNYQTLDADITPLAKSDPTYKLLEAYTNNTSSTGWRKCTIEEIFVVNRHSEGKRFETHSKLDNRKLLWHGTNVAVVGAIIKSGLRIMPHSGGRVGRGIYSASENAKSASYVRCAADGTTGIMFLNEVALGKEHHIEKDDSSLKVAPKGFDSIVAQGRTEPSPKGDKTITLDGKKVVVPAAKPENRPEYSNSNFSQTEYLVYREDQVRMRYILRMRFH